MPGARSYRHRIRPAVTRTVELGEVIFGDRRGVVLFLVALLFHAFTWRAGVFITDTYTIANGLVAVSEGHLEITRIVYGPESGATPGMHYLHGKLYARNYGQLVLALPFLWLLDGVAVVTDLRVALAAAWSLCLLLASVQVGHLLDRPRIATLAGSATALALFTANLVLTTDLVVPGHHLLALQLQTIVAVALTGVVVYRLVAAVETPRIGLAAGVAVTLASPLGFWATYPKRHAFVALFVACVAYWLVRNRRTARVRYRALAYGAVGLVAWVHAAEALILFVGLAAVDVATARQNDARTLAVVAGAFALSLVPMLLTNWFISGGLLRPPRLLSPYDGARSVRSVTLLVATIVPASSVLAVSLDFGPLGRLVEFLIRGLQVMVSEPERLYHVFVRSGYIPEVAAEDGGEAITLSLLESMPLVGALFGAPALLVRSIRAGYLDDGRLPFDRIRSALQTPAGTIDAFAVVFFGLLTLLYIPRLPIHASVTVRYLSPTAPVLVYLVTRLPSVRKAVRTKGNLLGWRYVGSVLIGSQLLFIVVLVFNLGLGEAVQLHALVSLGTGFLLVLWMIGTGLCETDFSRTGVVFLGLAAGATTVFLLLSGIDYFSYAGEYVLPVSELVNQLIFS